MTSGIHHITAIAADGRRCLYFYTHILGLRLVKKTVNQDDVSAYHLFFGDRIGHPGMDLTFFIFQHARTGKRGSGMVTCVSFAVPEAALSFWEKRLDAYGVRRKSVEERCGKRRIVFFDEDDQQLELVGVQGTELDGDVWETQEVSREHAIRSFYSATLSVSDMRLIDPFLIRVLGYEKGEVCGDDHVYSVSSKRAGVLEVRKDSSAGHVMTGCVHHIAFRASGTTEQMAFRDAIIDLGLDPTPVIDRFYFTSVYVRTPAGILFEIATDGPGFTADEPEESLGEALSLPPFLESDRKAIESMLPYIL